MTDDIRKNDLARFYHLLSVLEAKTGGMKLLANASSRDFPPRGVYFFQEPGEYRDGAETELRIVRVGTHAVSTGSRSKLWGRLAQHRGRVKSGGGNHRGSVFRAIIGQSFIARDKLSYPTWHEGRNAPREIRAGEQELEKKVSQYIRAMPFLCLPVHDDAGINSLRKTVESNAIALLSNYAKPALDKPSSAWLGHSCPQEKIHSSGLWNSNHVAEYYNRAFLDDMEKLVSEATTS